ncbi:diguanylate cyclase [Thalassotalea piscium]|uniref:diguanylate cyclase n=1 Tax=Thalassotalea piscium TaxID=1230533 RepID=A0A7X0NEV3_9GAMM|nr:diguanylate cyclase [Thalassotalea piscium]MBB6542148.1 diguanylate cyclase (GGDEF)-like protein [Thalassotalea piscium]
MNSTILVIDDAKDTLMLLEFDLIEAGYKVLTANGGEQALEILNRQAVDLVLLDLHMPKMSGMEVLANITALETAPPVIMLSASDDENDVVKTLDVGAEDYVTKPYVAKVLYARIRNALRLKEKTQELEALLRTDSLTHINNRVGYEELATKVISHAKRNKHRTAIAMLDIDHFKAVNDTHGHDGGDVVLVEFAKLLISCFRDYDVIGRIGGEEFAVCMPNVRLETALAACERFRESLAQLTISLPDDPDATINITVSIGLIVSNDPDSMLDDLMREADKLMYRAKSAGRNQTVTEKNKSENAANNNKDNELVTSKDNNNLNTNTPKQPESEKYAGIDFDIGVNNVLGDEGLFEEILVMFYQDHKQDKDKIAQAINDNDLLTLKSLTHTLKGVACSIGAMELFNHTKALDNAANDQKLQEFDYLFKPVALAINKVINGIETTLGDKL